MRYAALLRGINVGGNKKVSMAELRALAEGLGLDDPRTLLQSGNLVFGSTASPKKLEVELATETKKRIGLETTYFVRSASEWRAVIDANPFRDEAKRDPSRLVVLFLRDVPKPAAVKTLQSAIVGRETVRAYGKHAYIVYRDGIGRSKLTLSLIEKSLSTVGTCRNWNTTLKVGVFLAD